MSTESDLQFAKRSILDHEAGDPKYFCPDVVTLGTFSEGFYKRFDLEPDLYWKKFEGIVSEIPSILNRNTGASTPSIFKRASAFTIAFIKQSPLDQTLPPDALPRLSEIGNHQNAIVAFEYCRQCLHGATLVKIESGKDPQTVILNEKIKVSAHYYYDMIFAIAAIKSEEAFHRAHLDTAPD